MKYNTIQDKFYLGQRGYILAWIMVVASLTALLLANYMRTTTSERAANIRHIATAESRLAAESLVNYAAAEVVRQFRNEPLHAFSTYAGRQLEVPEEVIVKIGQDRIDVDSLKVYVGPDDDGLVGHYIDPNDPGNETDPLKGKITYMRTLNIFAEASAKYGSRPNEMVTRYAELALQVRDAPFFSSAFFYNMDLELMPEKQMDVYGPVYVNGDAYLGCDEGLNFHGPFHAAGDILHGAKLLNGRKFNVSAEVNHLGPIFFTDSNGNLVAMKRDPELSGEAFSDWIDTHPDNAATWSEDSYAAWENMVQNGVPIIDIAGYDRYVEDDPSTAGDETMNSSYAIIEPVLSTDHPNYKGEAVRKQKFAWKAGLFFRVSPDGYVSAHKYQRDANGAMELDALGNPIEIEVKLPAGLIGDANYTMNAIEKDAQSEVFKDYFDTYYNEVQVPVYETIATVTTLNVADEIAAVEAEYDDVLQDFQDSLGTDNAGLDPVAQADIWLQDAIDDIYAKDADGDGFYTIEIEEDAVDADGNLIQATTEDGVLVFNTEQDYAGRTELVEAGFKDHRQYKYGKNLDTLTLDINRLRQLISDGDADYSPEDWNVDFSEGIEADASNPDDDLGSEPESSGLIGEWLVGDMEQAVVNTIDNNFNGSYPADLSEKPTTANSQRGTSLYFDGINDRVELPSNFNLEGNAFTFSVWMNLASQNKSDARIISKATGTSTADHNFMLSTYGDGRLRVRLKTYDNPDGITLYSNDGTYDLNTWHHVAVTYDGAQLALIVDGEEKKSMEISGDIIQSNDVPVNIGNQPGDNHPLHGMLNQMTFYDNTLSRAEIASLGEVETGYFANNRGELPAFNPAQDWNGIVYIELPYNASERLDNIVDPVRDDLAVMLINGEDLPTQTDGGVEGFSLATNAPLYLLGNYNADGNLETGSATAYEEGEIPALLVADTFTLLGPGFADTEPIPATAEERRDFGPTGRRQAWRGINAKTLYLHVDDVNIPVEVSTALIAGIAPTIPVQPGDTAVKQSGGAHNVIRYLQEWKTEMRYRGSIVVLYENEVHKNALGADYRGIYRPPQRTIGFNDMFRLGSFPPGTPKGRTYRKAFLTYPSVEEYQQKVSSVTELPNT